MMARILRWPAIQGATWLEKWIAHKAKIARLINKREEGSWGNRAIQSRMRLAGHVQRHVEGMAWSVINYRDLAWWRARQMGIKSGPLELRHPGRYKMRNWESDMEDFWVKKKYQHLVDRFRETENYEPQCWAHLALNREVWRSVCADRCY